MNFVNTIILGPTGAGKSTLGNLLLYGMDEFEGGFMVGHGSHSETEECHQGVVQHGDKHLLQVIDTPGVPDTDPNKTLRGYDKIIEHVRRSHSLNAIIFLVALGRKEERDYRNYRALLRQFNALPCPKILVCRVDTDEGDLAKGRKEAAAKELIENVIKHAELENVERLILHRTNEKDVQELHQNICRMPSIDMARVTLRTYEEIKSRYEKLSKENTHISELRAEVSDLRKMNHQNEREIRNLNGSIHDLERKKTYTSGFAVVTSATLVLAPLGYFGFSKLSTYEKRLEIMANERGTLEKRVSTRTEAIQVKEAEIRSRSVDQSELKDAEKEFDELNSLTA